MFRNTEIQLKGEQTMNWPHLLHLLGKEQYVAYTIAIRNNSFRRLNRADGNKEMDEEVINTFRNYWHCVREVLEDGDHHIYYDRRSKTFHGLGTKHTPFRLVVHEGSNYSLYNSTGKRLAEEEDVDVHQAVNEDIFSLLPLHQIPPNEQGYQIDLSPETGRFRGFGGGDSAGGGAQIDFKDSAPSEGCKVETESNHGSNDSCYTQPDTNDYSQSYSDTSSSMPDLGN